MQNSYSFEGQDLIVNSILRKIKKGFYIDVGSNHPLNENDTYFFYKKKWTGLIIEPIKNFNKLSKKFRDKDIIINELIGLKKKTFYIFEEKNLSTTDIKHKNRYLKNKKKIKKKIKLIAKSLNEIIHQYEEKYCKQKIKIDFLKIDTEGSELEILKSINLLKYRPCLIQIEIKNLNLNNKKFLNHNVVKFLKKNNYSFVAKTLLDSFFIDTLSDNFKFLPNKLTNINI